MHAVKSFLRRRTALRAIHLRGQSVGEFVLLIALVGLVIVFAGPQVSQAINNQFGSVTNTLKAGNRGGTTAGGGIPGGSGGAGGSVPNQEQIKYLESMKPVTEKDPRNWTLADQQLAAEDIAKRGTASVAFPKAREAMDAGTKWTITLTNGKALEYKIIGINYDDLADGSGKAGLTFEATNNVLGTQRMNATNANAGGWNKSELRGRLNSGDLWALLPSELQSKAKAVTKMTDNKGGGSAGNPSATTDKIFLLSTTEFYGNLQSDGTQYEYYKSKGVSTSSYSGASSSSSHWTRSVTPSSSASFRFVRSLGDCDGGNAASSRYVFPAWCF